LHWLAFDGWTGGFSNFPAGAGTPHRACAVGYGVHAEARRPEGEREAAERYGLLEKARSDGMRAMGREWLQRMVHPDRLLDRGLIDAILDMIARKTPEIFSGQIRALLERPGRHRPAVGNPVSDTGAVRPPGFVERAGAS
jgi:hypothetical protein